MGKPAAELKLRYFPRLLLERVSNWKENVLGAFVYGCAFFCFVVSLMSSGCTEGTVSAPPPPPPPPVVSAGYDMVMKPGLLVHEEFDTVDVPYGVVNTADGNFMLTPFSLSIGSLLGPMSVGAVYNSTDRIWRWTWDMSMTANNLIGSSGSVYPLKDAQGGALYQNGGLIDGTGLIYYDSHRVMTKGGLIYDFDVATGRIKEMYWLSGDLGAQSGQCGGARVPRAVFTYAGGVMTKVEQCGASTCAPLFQVDYAGGRVDKITRWVDPQKWMDDVNQGTVPQESPFPYLQFTYSGDKIASVRTLQDVKNNAPGVRYEYNGSNDLIRITDGEGVKTEFYYYGGGQVERVVSVGEENPVQKFTYSKLAVDLYQTEVTYNSQQHDKYQYGSDRLLRSYEAVEGELKIDLTWDTNAKLLQAVQTKEKNLPVVESTRKYEYNVLKDVTKVLVGTTGAAADALTVYDVVYPQGIKENRDDPDSRMSEKVLVNGKIMEAQGFDSLGRLAKVVNGDSALPDTSTTHYIYDSDTSSSYAQGVEMCNFTAVGNLAESWYKTYNAPMANQVVHYYEGKVDPLKVYVLDAEDAAVTNAVTIKPGITGYWNNGVWTPSYVTSWSCGLQGVPDCMVVGIESYASNWAGSSADWVIPGMSAGEYFIWGLRNSPDFDGGAPFDIYLGQDFSLSPAGATFWNVNYSRRTPSIFPWSLVAGPQAEGSFMVSTAGDTHMGFNVVLSPYQYSFNVDKFIVTNYKDFIPLLYDGTLMLCVPASRQGCLYR